MGAMQLSYIYKILLFSFSVITFLGAKKREEQTAEMVREAAISNWLAIYGAPEILIADKDRRCIGGISQDFRTHVAI